MTGLPDRLGTLGESIGDALLKRAGRVAARVQERRPLSADVLESDDAYRVVFDAPGALGSDVQVRYVDGGVSVRVDRFRDFHEGYDMLFPGRGLSLDGRAELPDAAEIEPDAATAVLTKHGTLRVEIPKGEDAPDRTGFEADDDEDLDVDARVTTVDRTDEPQNPVDVSPDRVDTDAESGEDDATDDATDDDATDDEGHESDDADDEPGGDDADDEPGDGDATEGDDAGTDEGSDDPSGEDADSGTDDSGSDDSGTDDAGDDDDSGDDDGSILDDVSIPDTDTGDDEDDDQ